MKTGWQPMSSAPRDGTMILVTETPNGEHWNVLPAMYMNEGGGDPRFGQKEIGIIGWWGVGPSRRTGEGGDCELPVRWKPLAITPICWMPMPVREEESKLRRRMSSRRNFDKSYYEHTKEEYFKQVKK